MNELTPLQTLFELLQIRLGQDVTWADLRKGEAKGQLLSVDLVADDQEILIVIDQIEFHHYGGYDLDWREKCDEPLGFHITRGFHPVHDLGRNGSIMIKAYDQYLYVQPTKF